MTNHDQRFKVLLQEFLREFFFLFYPQWAACFDFARIEWLTQEVFTDPPTGRRRYLDLVARIPLLQPLPGQPFKEGDPLLALVHIEIEYADTVQPLRERMYDYHGHLRRQYRVPTISIALYLNVALEGLGIDTHEEYFDELRTVQFQYPYVGLPGLDAEKYVQGDNWLGVALATLMRCPHEVRTRLTADALRRLMACPENDHRRFLLCECVSAYAPLNQEQRKEVARSLVSTEEGRTMTQMMSLFEHWEQKGTRRSLRMLLEEKFGPLSPAVVERLDNWPAETLDQLFRAAVRAQSLQELGLENGAGDQS